MSKNEWVQILSQECHDNAEFAYLWAMSAKGTCTQSEAISAGSQSFQKAVNARRKTQRANNAARCRNSIMRDMGLTRCVGSVSGKVYWE